MSKSINRVMMAGNLVRDPEQIANGKGCTFSVALNDDYKKDDEWVDRTHFVDVKVWGGQAKPCMENLHKGRQVAIDGKLEQERWEQDGKKRSKLVVTAWQVQFIGPHKDEGPPEQSNGDSAKAKEAEKDDIPF